MSNYSKPRQSFLDRNNTSFPLKVKEFISDIRPNDTYSFLKYYQNVTREYRKATKNKGLLINYDMGLGKTLVAVAIIMDNIAERECIFISGSSLHANMRSTIIKYIGLRSEHEPTYYLGRLPRAELEKWIDRNFKFISIGANNLGTQFERAANRDNDDIMDRVFGDVAKIPNLNNKQVVVDEAHDFFRAIVNGSTNAMGVAKLIGANPSVFVLFLTGSLISNDPFETVPCFNLLAGEDVLPTEYRDFNRVFVDEKSGSIKNKAFFQSRILGLVSTVKADTQLGSGLGKHIEQEKAEFPEKLPLIIKKFTMIGDQLDQYRAARNKERDEGRGKSGSLFDNRFAVLGGPSTPMMKPKNNMASTYRVRSRQLGICAIAGETSFNKKDIMTVPVEDIISPKIDWLLETFEPGKLAVAYSQFNDRGYAAFKRKAEAKGWVEVKARGGGGGGRKTGSSYEDAQEYMKILGAMDFSEADLFAAGSRRGAADDEAEGEAEAADEAAEAAEAAEGEIFTEVRPEAPEPKEIKILRAPRPDGPIKFAVINGEVPLEERAELVEMYNNPENAHGGIIDLLFISKTGAQGLDLKRVRKIYVVEPYHIMYLILQIFQRGVRYNSHIDLDPSEKNVQPIVMLSVDPETKSTDEDLWETSSKEQLVIDSFTEAIAGASIECLANNSDASKCFTCVPDDKKIYTGDIFADLRAPSPCRSMIEKKVRALPFFYEGRRYYYTSVPAAESIFELAVYDEIGGQKRRMAEHDPLYKKIVSAISAAAGRPDDDDGDEANDKADDKADKAEGTSRADKTNKAADPKRSEVD